MDGSVPALLFLLPPPAQSQSPITLAVVFGATVVETPGTGSRRRGRSEQGTSLDRLFRFSSFADCVCVRTCLPLPAVYICIFGRANYDRRSLPRCSTLCVSSLTVCSEYVRVRRDSYRSSNSTELPWRRAFHRASGSTPRTRSSSLTTSPTSSPTSPSPHEPSPTWTSTSASHGTSQVRTVVTMDSSIPQLRLYALPCSF
jgi:hypothetical protein